jgi:hypothetical protein
MGGPDASGARARSARRRARRRHRQAAEPTDDGVTQEFFGMGVVNDKAKDAEGMAANALKKAFGS